MSWWPFKTARKLDDDIAEHRTRERLRARVQKLLDKWQPIIGVHVREVHVKKMSSYWATINEGASRMWVNERLATAHAPFLQYIIVHELVHLRTDGHDDKFYALMDKYLPGWRRHHEANAAPMTQHS